MTGFDFEPIINLGVAGIILLWFMFRLERILNRLNKNINLMARATIRLLERHDPDMASDLSKELYKTNGEGD